MTVTGRADLSAEELGTLLRAVGRDRDRSAFQSLFAHFAPRVKAFLQRIGTDAATAEELAQEVMLLVWRRAETFDPRQASAATWVFAIARNRRIDAFRRERRPEFDPEDPALVPDPEPAPDVTLSAAQTSARLRDAIRTLPREQSDLLLMAYSDDKAHSAIAEERGIPLGTVKSRLRLAHARLRKVLGDFAP